MPEPVSDIHALVAALRRDVLEARQVLQPIHQLLPRDSHGLWEVCTRERRQRATTGAAMGYATTFARQAACLT